MERRIRFGTWMCPYCPYETPNYVGFLVHKKDHCPYRPFRAKPLHKISPPSPNPPK